MPVAQPAAAPDTKPGPAPAKQPPKGAAATTGAHLVKDTPAPVTTPGAAPAGDAKAGAQPAPVKPKVADTPKAGAKAGGAGAAGGGPATVAGPGKVDPKKTDPGKGAAGGPASPAQADHTDAAKRQAIDGAQSKVDEPLPHGLPSDDKQAIIRDRKTAKTVDAAIPPDERAQVVKDQQAALASAKQAAAASGHHGPDDRVSVNDAYGDYWKTHKYYVDPKTNTVYRASYDSTTGVVHAERFDDPNPDPAAQVTRAGATGGAAGGGQAAPSAPGRNLPGDPTKGGPTQGSTGPKANPPKSGTAGTAGGAGGSAGGGTATAGPDALLLSPAQAAAAAKQDKSTSSLGPVQGPFGGPVGPSDVTLDVSIDGSQTRTVSTKYGNSDAGGNHTATTDEAADGTLNARTDKNASWTHKGDEFTYDTSASTVNGAGVTTHDARSSHRTDSHGSFGHSTDTTMNPDGSPKMQVVTSTANQGGKTASESDTTNFANGKPATGTNVQTLDAGGTRTSGTLEVTYTGESDAFGQPRISAIKQSGTSGADLDKAFADGQPGDTPRFTFGTVRNPGNKDNGDTIYVSQPGVRLKHGNLDVYVEGGDLSAGSNGGRRTADTVKTIDGAPPELLTSTKSIDATLGQSPGDVAAGVRYGIPNFVSEADAGGGHINFYSGAIFHDEPAFWHELGHINADKGGTFDDPKWQSAMSTDRATRKALIDTPGAKITWDHVERGAFQDESGVTGYATSAFDGPAKFSGEDWAESTQLWIDSQQNGSIATMKLADGSTRKLTFEDMFPERAKILQAKYGKLTIPPKPEDTLGAGMGGMSGFGARVGTTPPAAPPPAGNGSNGPGS